MITAELPARHDRPGPRYTSYPTAVDLTPALGPDDHGRLQVRLTEQGRPFVRRLAQVFDAHSAHRPGDRPTFSRAP